MRTIIFWNKNTARSASLEDGALHLQFRGRAKGATGRFAVDRTLVMNYE